MPSWILSFLRVFDRRIITEGIRVQLPHQPLVETRNRKLLRENPLAPWALRIRQFRVFYKVEDEVVAINAIGYKKHNTLFIRGKEVTL